HTRSDRDWSSDVCSSDLSHDAVRKLYRYVIHDGDVPSPFQRRYACQSRRPLDAAAMARAAVALRGRHDFRCFETEWPNRFSSVRSEERRVGKEAREGWAW